MATEVGDSPKKTLFSPAAAATKKWKVCALVPHMKDSYWVAANYGLVSEAERLGVALNVYQAGGYDQLPRQVAQFDDCMAGQADAIIIAPISEAGLAAKIREADRRGIATVGLINPILEAPVTAKVTNDQIAMGRAAGAFLSARLGDKGGKVVAFPGPQGSGWAEKYLEGFKKAVATGSAKVVADKFGDPGVAVQLRLVEDSLQAFPDLNAIWGTGPTAEAAVGAVAEAGAKNVVIVSSYADQSSVDLLKKGKIAGFAADSTVMQARVALDLAVLSLEKRPFEKLLIVGPTIVSSDNLASTDMTAILAPTSFKPTFAVK